MAPPGLFVISLDFELFWGVRDKCPLERCKDRLLGVRRAIPAMLDLFRHSRIHATWAVVGMLFFRSQDELIAQLPQIQPSYADPKLSPYPTLSALGQGETDDPFHFAPSLIAQILETPHQELGTHTFSHFYCLEPGHSRAAFQADLRAAIAAAKPFGVELKSIVFPRNQINPDYLPLCAEAGITCYRGNPRSWLYHGRAKNEESRWRRLLRFVDAYVPISGDTTHPPHHVTPTHPRLPTINVPASRFLRPASPRLQRLEGMRTQRILREMTHAARTARLYHLWWHPENFGLHVEQNLAVLRRILDHARLLRDTYGFQSATMTEAAEAMNPHRPPSPSPHSPTNDAVAADGVR